MNASLASGRPVRLVIRRMGIRASSSIDARRLADALGPALERALEREAGTGPARRPSRLRPADHAAAAIVAAVALRLKDAAP